MLKILFDTWDYQGNEGFVFVSERDTNLPAGSDGYWKDICFAWPDDKSRVEAWFKKERTGIDLYWSPAIFSGKKRSIHKVIPGKVLYADLDPVNPNVVKYRPSIAWESSRDRFQALWFLKDCPEDFETLNRDLTYSMGADRGGWDLTQVLRIPGTYNNKYNPPIKGQLLWADNDKVYNNIVVPSASQQDIKEGNLLELLSKYRKQIPTKVSRLLQYPPERVDPGHRSDILWSIENDLVAAKIPMEDIALMIQASAWNKYRGRTDEWMRITTEISKIYANKVPVAALKEDRVSNILPIKKYGPLMGEITETPGWLIKDIWMKKSHGIIAGEPKTYKTTLALDMAVSVASGIPLWGIYPVEETGPVIIVQNENADWIIKDRLEKITASKGIVGEVVSTDLRHINIKFAPELPIYFLNNFGFNFSDPTHCEEIEDVIASIRPSLVIFDPLYLMFEGEINSAKDLQPVLQWLLSIRNQYKTSIMLIHHWNKNGSASRGGQRMLGSTTLHGWTDSSIFLNRVGTEEGKVCMEREFRAARGGNSKLELSIEMGEFSEALYSVTLSEASLADKGSLLDILASYPGGCSQRLLSKELGVSRDKILTLIKQAGTKVKVVKGKYYLGKGEVDEKLIGQ